MPYRAAVLLALLAAACGGKKEAPPPAPAPTPVAIFQDDRQVATSAALSAKPRPLVELAPGAPAPETWLAVVVFDASGTATTALAPSTNHPDAAAALTAGKDGVTFGFARGDTLDAPVARVVKVVIKTRDDRGQAAAEAVAMRAAAGSDHGGDHAGEHGGDDSSGAGGHQGDNQERPVPTSALTIAIKSASGESVLTGDKLVGLPAITAPVGDTATPGWNLLDVLKVAGLDQARAVNLSDEEGSNLRLEGADFDPSATVLYIKLNRQGQIRFRRYGKKRGAWEMTGELRGISKIAVVK